ncbi:MAG: M91 family zinc metallopeptidase [bacterium]
MDPATYGITITPTGLAGAASTKYTTQVREHLQWIEGTKMGMNLLRSIRFHATPVVIEPYTGADCNASGGSRTVGGVRNGHVSYSPDTFSLHGACPVNRTKPNRGMLWDEILFHELVHVLRAVSGVFAKKPLQPGLYRYTNTEEFFAVVITNVYVSDPTNRIKTGLRGEHRGFRGLDPAYGEPFAFFGASTQVFDLVKQFVGENHGFSTMVANTKAKFNPIADYYASPDRCAQASKNAVGSDLVGLTADLLGL